SLLTTCHNPPSAPITAARPNSVIGGKFTIHCDPFSRSVTDRSVLLASPRVLQTIRKQLHRLTRLQPHKHVPGAGEHAVDLTGRDLRSRRVRNAGDGLAEFVRLHTWSSITLRNS